MPELAEGGFCYKLQVQLRQAQPTNILMPELAEGGVAVPEYVKDGITITKSIKGNVAIILFVEVNVVVWELFGSPASTGSASEHSDA